MKNILNTHIYKLRFRLDFDAPDKYIKKWKEIKKDIETSDNVETVEEIKNNCKLQSNKNLPYLVRSEGGLGGNSNINNKQIRFRYNYGPYEFDNDILLSVYNSDLNNEKWTYEELDDIIYSFVKVLNQKMKSECVKGCIEIINKNMYNGNYSDDDDETDY